MFKSLAYHYKIAIIYTLILFLDRIDLTVLNVAIPTLTKVFTIPIELAEWFRISF
jgi:DHA2 family multidrug resistance protein/DHA2 family multidrug resistance protein-like MFS transporter